MSDAGIFRFLKFKSRSMSTRIVLVDDHAILMDGIKSILEKDDSLSVVHQASSAEQALQYLKTNTTDIVITDFHMPGMDGLSFVRTIKHILPDVRIIMLSQHDEVHLVKEILRSGVHGYVLKKDSHKELLDAIKSVEAGKLFLSNDINKLLVQNLQNPDEGKLLTDREG